MTWIAGSRCGPNCKYTHTASEVLKLCRALRAFKHLQPWEYRQGLSTYGMPVNVRVYIDQWPGFRSRAKRALAGCWVHGQHIDDPVKYFDDQYSYYQAGAPRGHYEIIFSRTYYKPDDVIYRLIDMLGISCAFCGSVYYVKADNICIEDFIDRQVFKAKQDKTRCEKCANKIYFITANMRRKAGADSSVQWRFEEAAELEFLNTYIRRRIKKLPRRGLAARPKRAKTSQAKRLTTQGWEL